MLKLLLPILFPSWRFFEAVEPSPRVDWWQNGAWHRFYPRPERISLWQMGKRLFWNPAWNEALFVTSLAERIELGQVGHSSAQIQARIAQHSGLPAQDVLFRLVLVQRDGEAITRAVTFTSQPEPR